MTATSTRPRKSASGWVGNDGPDILTPLRAGTVCVTDLERSRRVYEQSIGYGTVETGAVTRQLACAWGAPAVAGAPYALMRPASGAATYLRLVEALPVEEFQPLVSHGWTALEFCVQDVVALAEKLADSPFEVVGPPRRLDGMEGICAMQVRGVDGEICYFTQIDRDPPGLSLPRARCFVDRLFIHVLGASDLAATQRWIARHVACDVGIDRMEMVYTMLARAFGAPLDARFTVSTMVRGNEVCLQVDQLPRQAIRRPGHRGMLPPGIAMTTLTVPDLGAVGHGYAAAPAVHEGVIYGGRRSVTLADPDGTLFELVEEE